ncbi:hypothetical protein C8E01_102310 [Pontibacter virosus]|uniref:Uncharacterized protein n=1 Tax=Pontibacter virosus TaxID=1765052 RepID=A0A2U1B396_9BACT|nr:hypothetical protein C8E01_102310 [Pontibacter virosus]
MLDGLELEGYIMYRASIGKSEVAEAGLGAAK